MFEACNLIIHHCSLPNDVGNSKLRDQAVTLLARFISVREPNIRYLGLSSMTKLAKLGDVGHLIAEHQNRILFTLKDGDISIRRRALDLVFAMCNESNAEELVDELLNYLVSSSVWGRGINLFNKPLVDSTLLLLFVTSCFTLSFSYLHTSSMAPCQT